MEEKEGLFKLQVSRKPNKYPWTEEFINAMWSSHWTPNEFDFKSDYSDFKKRLTEQEKQMIVRNITAIGQVEIAVKTFWAKLGENLPHPSLYDLGYVMANTEVIHNKAYEKLLDCLNLGKAFEENLKEPCIAGRVEYLRKYLDKVYKDDKKQYIYAITLFTLFVENVSLFSQFYVILWMNRYKNVLRDTAQQVQYTRQEETIHANVGIKIINTLKQEYPELFDDGLYLKIYQECDEALKAESNIIDWIVGDYSEEFIDKDILKEYIKSRLNTSLKSIGLTPRYEVDGNYLYDNTNWMTEELMGNTHTDFFHGKPIEYAKSNKTYALEDLF